MKYKALILDLDGTTIPQNSDKPPSKRVSDAIAKAKDKIHVCIATGRPLYISKHIIDHLQLSGPCIINNGTQIYDPQTNEVIKEFPLERSRLPFIFKVFRRYKKEIRVFDGIEDKSLNEKNLPDVVFSIYLSDVESDIGNTIIRDLEKIPRIVVHKMPSEKNVNNYSLEVTSSLATKLHGIVEVTKILGIRKEEIIGVGDSYNDFPLLMASGLKIAMGNAIEDLKAIADFIAPSVDDDGVATIIEKFILS